MIDDRVHVPPAGPYADPLEPQDLPTESPYQEIDALCRFNRRLISASGAEEIIQAILSTIAETEADGCVIARFHLAQETGCEADAITLLGAWDRDAEPHILPGFLCCAPGNTLPLTTSSSVRIMEDITQVGASSAEGYESLFPWTSGAVMSIPLRVGARTIGVMMIRRARPGPLSPTTIPVYEILGYQAALALDRLWLLEEAQRRATEEETVSRITAQMHETLDIDLVLRTAVREIATAFHIPRVEVRMATRTNGPESQPSQVETGGKPC